MDSRTAPLLPAVPDEAAVTGARPAVKPAWTPATRFEPVLSSAVFQTRWLDSFATPCHAHGRSF